MNISLLNQRYVPICKLGAGGMAEVFLARQTGEAGFQREVALKKIHHRLSDHPRAVRMFLEEAKLAASLCHPNIVQIFDVGREEKNFFIVMERVDGVDLRMLAERTTALGQMIPLDISLTIIGQVLEGLMYAHSFHDEADRPMTIVHGDIGPNNILVSYHGGVKLVDFGIARAEDQIREEGAVPAGKIAYMSPESVKGYPLDARSDLFGVGILLYELTVGQRLFRVNSFESMRRILTGPIAPPTYARPSYPADLENIVMRALEMEPDDRYGSAEEMLEDLEQFAFNYNERLSRLKLSRFVRRTMGVATAESIEDKTDQVPEPVASEPADLDFDNAGTFEEQPEPPAREVGRSPLQRQPSMIIEAMQQADAAIAELEAASLSAGPEEKTETSAVVVTEDLVEEEIDLDEPILNLDRPKRRGFLDESLDADLDAGLEEDTEDDETLLLNDPTPLADIPMPARREQTRAESPSARRRADTPQETEPSEDLIAALADISVDLGTKKPAAQELTEEPERIQPEEAPVEADEEEDAPPAADLEDEDDHDDDDQDDDDDLDDITIDLDLEDLEEEELAPDEVMDLDPQEPPPIPDDDDQDIPQPAPEEAPAAALSPAVCLSPRPDREEQPRTRKPRKRSRRRSRKRSRRKAGKGKPAPRNRSGKSGKRASKTR